MKEQYVNKVRTLLNKARVLKLDNEVVINGEVICHIIKATTEHWQIIIPDNITDMHLDSGDKQEMLRNPYFRELAKYHGSIEVYGGDSLQTLARAFSLLELEKLDLQGLSTDNVTNMESIFNNSTIKTLVIEDLNTKNVKNMSTAFSHTTTDDIDLTKWDFTSVNNMNGIFLCARINTLKLPSIDCNKLKKCTSLFDLSSIGTLSIPRGKMYELYIKRTNGCQYF